MLERWNSEQPARLSRGLVLVVSAFCFLSLFGVEHSAVAATAQASSSTNDKNKRALACKVDIQRFCSEANLKQDCLVARWDKISAECRNVLRTSAGNRADSGT
jgi:hypothetical protein